MALDIKPTRSELINLKRRIKQTSSGYNLLKIVFDGLFHEFRTLLSEMIAAREELVGTFRDALQAIISESRVRNSWKSPSNTIFKRL
jgi:V/A-type H+-transporting ATPase subunit D